MAPLLPADGYFRILGRVDDVINVAGHRLGTKEVESACLTVREVAEAAVVPVVDDVKGRVPEVYVALKPGVLPSKAMQDKITSTIETMIGKIARPKTIHIVPDMPKTRSGKIMRRVLAAISNTWTPATSPRWPIPTSSSKSANRSKAASASRSRKAQPTSNSSAKKPSPPFSTHL